MIVQLSVTHEVDGHFDKTVHHQHPRVGREGAKRATEHILRLRYCGALTTWGPILVLLVLWRACDAVDGPFCRTQLAYLSLARLFARLEASQECLVRGTR